MKPRVVMFQIGPPDHASFDLRAQLVDRGQAVLDGSDTVVPPRQILFGMDREPSIDEADGRLSAVQRRKI